MFTQQSTPQSSLNITVTQKWVTNQKWVTK